MRYLPIVALSLGLVAIVMAMAGNREKGVRTGLGIGVVVLAFASDGGSVRHRRAADAGKLTVSQEP